LLGRPLLSRLAMLNSRSQLRREFVEQAVKFLITLGVHDGTPEEVSVDDKVAFLKQKGLTPMEITEAQRMVSFFCCCCAMYHLLFTMYILVNVAN